MQYEEMRTMEKTHRCAQCGGGLVTRWDADLADHYLACGTDPHHEGFQRTLVPGERLVRGELNHELGPGAQADAEKVMEAQQRLISRLPLKDLATGEHIANGKILDLIYWGMRHGLKPYLGHVCLYYGEPYVTIDGYYYLKVKRGLTWSIGTRPLTADELERYKVGEGDFAWTAEKYEAGQRAGDSGMGIVTRDEIESKSKKSPDQFRAPVAHDHPQRMAEKRAEWQLLRKLLPLEEVEG